jgi:HTH-type transcriptional regulator / antitoxin HigA
MSASVTDSGAMAANVAVVVVPESYLDLVRQFPLLGIRTARDHAAALKMANELLKKKASGGALDQGESGYLGVLLQLIETYEKQTFPRRRCGDGEMLEHLIESRGISQAELQRRTGVAAPTISAVIAGRRRLTRQQIGKISAYFKVAPTAFSFES